MSWLSKLSKVLDPVGSALHENSTVQKLDPLGTAVFGSGQQGSNAGISDALNGAMSGAAGGADAPADPSQGNAADPSYGSFTKPFDVQSFYQNLDPGYFFRLQSGQQGLANSAAAGSGALSGSALKDLMNYNQDAASSEYGNAFNRYQTTQGNIFNRLATIAGYGQASAANVGANNTALAGTAGQALQNAGTAQGAGIVGAGNALSSGMGTYGAYNYMNRGAPVVK